MVTEPHLGTGPHLLLTVLFKTGSQAGFKGLTLDSMNSCESYLPEGYSRTSTNAIQGVKATHTLP